MEVIYRLNPSTGHKITVGAVVATLPALIDAAAGSPQNLPVGEWNGAILTVESGQARFTLNDEDPTANGERLYTAGRYIIKDSRINKMKLIREGGSDATIQIEVGIFGPKETISSVI